MDSTNYINAEIYITEEDKNKNIRIINSFENFQKELEMKARENDYIQEMKKKQRDVK